MKKFFAFVLAAFFAAASVLPAFASSDTAAAPLTGETINVYNWALYIADGSDDLMDVNAEFTRRTGIQVNYTTYDTNEALYSKLKTGGASYDVIIPSDYMVAKLIEEGLVQKIDYSNIPNYYLIDQEFKDQSFDPANEYSVPYTWGTVGLIYNTKYVTEPVDSWDVLWNADYSGKILMFDNSRDAFAISELLLGLDVNTTDENDIQKAADKLAEQKSVVQSYVMDNVFEQMESEAAWVAPYYTGDCMTMMAENSNLAFAFPKEGYNLFIDSMCIPTSTQNKTAAEKYINFMCDPEISAQNMNATCYSTPITEAKQYMDADLAGNAYVYPSAEVLEKGVAFSNLPTKTIQQMNEAFNKVKTSDSGWSVYMLIALGVIVAFLAIFIPLRRKKRMKY